MLPDRFWDKTCPEPNTGCLLWIGALQGTQDYLGYGIFWLNGRLRPAHIVAYEDIHGPVPKGLWVLHKCDMPWCVLHQHLFLGTHQDNVDDKIRKGRHPIGVNDPVAKLNDENVREIRMRLSQGETGASLSREFGVGENEISRIKLRKRWIHI